MDGDERVGHPIPIQEIGKISAQLYPRGAYEHYILR